jgi:hypothetical protein
MVNSNRAFTQTTSCNREISPGGPVKSLNHPGPTKMLDCEERGNNNHPGSLVFFVEDVFSARQITIQECL